MAQEGVLIDLSSPPSQLNSVKSFIQASRSPCSLDLSPQRSNNPFDSIAKTAEAFSEKTNDCNEICSKTNFENNFDRDEMDDFKSAQIKGPTTQDEYPDEIDETFLDNYEDLMSVSPPPEFYFSFDDENDFGLPAVLKLSLRDSLTCSPPESEILSKYKQQRQLSLSLRAREEEEIDVDQQCRNNSLLGISEECKHLEPVSGVINKALIDQSHIPEIKLRKPCVEKSSKGPLKAMKPLQKMVLKNTQGTSSKINQDFAKLSLNKNKAELVQRSCKISAGNQKLLSALPRSKSDHTISTKEGTPQRTSLSQKFRPRSNSIDRTKFVPVASSSPCLNIRGRTPNGVGKMYSRISSTPITTPTTHILKSLELKTQLQHPNFDSSRKLQLQKFNDKDLLRTPPIKVMSKLKSSRNDSLCDKENIRARNK